MRFSFHPCAKMELNQAVCYYESCRAGLGSEFAEEIRLTVCRIAEFPEAWSQLTENTRRCLTKRFPYGVIYQIAGDQILIIAVMQMNREPDYWKNRIQ